MNPTFRNYLNKSIGLKHCDYKDILAKTISMIVSSDDFRNFIALKQMKKNRLHNLLVKRFNAGPRRMEKQKEWRRIYDKQIIRQERRRIYSHWYYHSRKGLKSLVTI